MCGIAGFIDFTKTASTESLQAMVASLHHRGPDDSGAETFENEYCLIGFGQARLSIIDLSHGGHQPMHFKHLSCVFNGEVYNYQEIKDELIALGHEFSSNSDTEVILHAYDEWGLDAVHRFIGMFVFTIYNREKNTLSISRDRAGVKPLYYFRSGDHFLFGSELKALMAHPNFKKEIAPEVLAEYLQYGYIAAPNSIFKETFKLEPGHHLTIDLSSKKIEIEKYWDPSTFYSQPKLKLSYDEAKNQLHELMKSACQYRMVADVPVGVFLSGGYDSTAVTSILQGQSQEKIKTFTIGFEEGNNEAPFAKETAEYLGTDHTEYFCSTEEAQEIIKDLPFFYDEPFGDSSAIPTILVSKLAKQKVTVALSADAGDELFFGYNSYFQQASNLNKLKKVPKAFKPAMALMAPLAKSWIKNEATAHKASSFLASLNTSENVEAAKLFYYAKRKPEEYIAKLLTIKPEPRELKAKASQVKNLSQAEDSFMLADYQDYLQNDILTKVDRATMSVSLEGREPFLDHRLLEFSARLPLSFKYQDGSKIGKDILRDIVHEYVPREMMERPKTGFSIPVLEWLRKDLFFLQEKYLSEEALQWSGLLNVPFVLAEIRRFNERKMHYSPVIWYILMFQMWYDQWINKAEVNA